MGSRQAGICSSNRTSAGTSPWQGSLAFGQVHAGGELLDPRTGTIRPLPEPARIELDLEGWDAAIVRLTGVACVSRLSADQAGLARLLAD